MAFPHPKSRKEHYRNDDKPNTGGVLWNFFKRTINIPEYRNLREEEEQWTVHCVAADDTEKVAGAASRMALKMTPELSPRNGSVPVAIS
jgi:hypothetical protein